MLFWLKFQKLEEGSFFFHKLSLYKQAKDGRPHQTQHCHNIWLLTRILSFWVLPLWGFKTCLEVEATRDLLVFFFLPPEACNCSVYYRNLIFPWFARKLQRLLSLMLIYPVCGNVYLLDWGNVVENFKSSKWIKSLIMFWETFEKVSGSFIFLGCSNESWQKFHVRGRK